MKTVKILSFDEFKIITKEQDEKRIENVYLMDVTLSCPICIKIANLTFDSIIRDVFKSPEYVFFEIIDSENEVSENTLNSEDRYLEEMKRAVEISKDDEEQGHGLADTILCDFLKHLGYTEIVNEFEKVQKWYA